ncbi:MAG: ArnT family glycosyltransferase, partial [Desulfomonilaceae bacterium]
FPLYLLAREFLNKKEALIVCFVVLTLPFFNLSTFVMVESTTLPLFLTCFYLAFKCMSTMSLKYALLTALFLVISFFSKTTALLSGVAIVISFLVLMMFGPRRRIFGIRSAVVYIAVSLCFGLILYLLLQRFLIVADYFNMLIAGRIKSFLFSQAITTPTLGELIKVSLAHVDTILLTYLLPVCVIILVLFNEGRASFFKDMNKRSIFAVMLFSFVLVYLASVVRYSAIIFPKEHFGRLHARYYFMIFPLLVVGFATFFPLLEWRFKERSTLLIIGAIVISAGIVFFLPQYVSQGPIFVDNPDLAWYSRPNKLLIIPVGLTFILTILYYVISARPSRNVFLWSLLCYALVGNFGEIRAAVFNDKINLKAFRPYIDFVGSQITNVDSRVIVFGEGTPHRTFLPFWKRLKYVGIVELPTGSRIERQLIPSDADYLILFGEYQLDFPVESAVTRGKCKIIALHNSVDEFKKGFPYKFGDILKFTEGGNYARYIGAGWGGPEKGFVWSDGAIAHMQIPLASSSDSDLILRVNCVPFLAPPKLTQQRVKVIAGNKKLCDWTVTKAGEYECVIPAAAIKDSMLDLTFEFPDAASPKDYNLSEDSRKLGLAFQSVIITKAGKSSANSERR